MNTVPTLKEDKQIKLLEDKLGHNHSWALWGVRQQIRDYYARKDALSIGEKNE